jgi:hypothetical protein
LPENQENDDGTQAKKAKQTEAGQPQKESAIRVTGEEIAPFGIPVKELRERIKEWASRQFKDGGAEEVNRDTGRSIFIQWQGMKHAIADANEAELRLLPKVRALVISAKHVGSEPDKSSRSHIIAAHKYVAKAVLNGEPLDVGIVVRERKDGSFFYDQFILKNESPLGISDNTTASVSAASDSQPSSGDRASVPQPPAKAQGPAMVALQKQKAKRDAEAGLTSPTPEQIRATEEAKAAAAKAEKAAKAADDARAKLEQERKEIAARSAAAADTFELGQDPMANLTGQKDVFADQKPEVAPAPANDLGERWTRMTQVDREALAAAGTLLQEK